MAFSNSRPYLTDSTVDSRIGAMTFEDDFFGSDINRSVWDAGGWANPDWSNKNYDCTTYTDGNGVQRSVLRIWPVYDASVDPNSSTSYNGFPRRDVTTINPGFRQQYGYFEASMKLNWGQGVWPAFWLFDISGTAQEIDIMEAYCGGEYDWSDGAYHPTDFEATTHANGGVVDHTRLSNTLGKRRLDTGFHVYGCEWTAEYIKYYFDGQLFATHWHNGAVTKEMVIWFDVWFGNPNASTAGIPAYGVTPVGNTNAFEIEYVRAWLHTSGGYATGPAAASGTGTTTAPPATDTGSGTTADPTVPVAPQSGNPLPTLGALTFNEDFNGTGLDAAVWVPHEWYLPDDNTPNYEVSNGSLKLFPTSAFVNRSITTDGTFAQRYGYFEARMKLCRGQGTWPAFWLYQHIDDATGSYRPEIDIMEAYCGGAPPWSDGQTNPTDYGFTLHKANADYSYHVIPYAQKLSDITNPMRLDTEFHLYGVLWTKDTIQFYFDRVSIGQVTVNDYWNWPMYIDIDLWYGSASGQPDASTPLGVSNSFEIDYVRAWALADGSTSVVTNLPTPAPSPNGGTTGGGTGGAGTGGTGTGGTGTGGTAEPANTYAAGDQFSIRYDQGTVKYLKNGSVVRTVTNVDPLRTYYFDSSFYKPGAKLLDVSFGKIGTVDWASITGAGKPEDGATVGATIGTNLSGQITPALAPTLIGAKAITNALIGDVIQSDSYSKGYTGWKIDKQGNVEFNSGVFRGTLGANTVTAQNIVSRSATWFELYTRSAANNVTQDFSLDMDVSGTLMAIVIVNWAISGDATTASLSLTTSIDGGSVSTLSSTGYSASSASVAVMTGSGNLGAGTHTLTVTANHNLASGNHVIYVQALRSYR